MVFVHHSFFSHLQFFFLSHEISPRAEKNLHIDLDIRSSSMSTINEKRHIKNLFHTIKFFLFFPLKKNWNQKKNKFSYNSIHKQSNSFNKKTFLFLKKQDTENLTKKTTGKKIRDCISSSH